MSRLELSVDLDDAAEDYERKAKAQSMKIEHHVRDGSGWHGMHHDHAQIAGWNWQARALRRTAEELRRLGGCDEPRI